MAVSKKRKKGGKKVQANKSIYPEGQITTQGAKVINSFRGSIDGFNGLYISEILEDVSVFMENAQGIIETSQEAFEEESSKEKMDISIRANKEQRSILSYRDEIQENIMHRMIAEKVITQFIYDGLSDIINQSHDRYITHLREILHNEVDKLPYKKAIGPLVKHLEFLSHNCMHNMSLLVREIIDTVQIELEDYEKSVRLRNQGQTLANIANNSKADDELTQDMIDQLKYIADNYEVLGDEREDLFDKLMQAVAEKNDQLLKEEMDKSKVKKETYNRTRMYKYQELNKIAEENGFELLRHNGDHGVWSRKEPFATIIIPQGRDIGRGLQNKILKVLLDKGQGRGQTHER